MTADDRANGVHDDDRDGTLSLDRLFETVAREPRRRVLDALREGSPRTVEELTDQLTRQEVRDRDTVGVALRHNHLPRLDAAGVARWDRRHGTVTRGPQFEEIRPFLELMADRQDALPDGWP